MWYWIWIHNVIGFEYTVKPVNKGNPRERQNIVFILEVKLFLFSQGMVTKVWSFFQGGLYSEMAFIRGLTV